MSRAALTLKIYAICFGIAGFGLLVAPNPLLPLFGFPTTEEVWIHLIGLLMVSLATYDYIAGQNGLAPIISASIPTRLVAGAVMILTWILDIVGPGILFFAAVDIVGALSTLLALRGSPVPDGQLSGSRG